MADEHFCIPDDNDNCVECGQRIDLPEIAEIPDLGDIMGMIRLIDDTAKKYMRMVEMNTDPADPALPRLRIVGGQIMRLPHKSLYGQFFVPSYRRAKELGYRGSLERWSEILQEAVEASQPQPS